MQQSERNIFASKRKMYLLLREERGEMYEFINKQLRKDF